MNLGAGRVAAGGHRGPDPRFGAGLHRQPQLYHPGRVFGQHGHGDQRGAQDGPGGGCGWEEDAGCHYQAGPHGCRSLEWYHRYRMRGKMV